MGESEAYYRMLPYLHLSESNIKCVFVPTGFEEDRSRFFLEVKNLGQERLVDDTEEKDGTWPDPSETISIPGFEGKSFKEATPLIEKYMKRPRYLEDMCFAQFVMSYEMMPLNAGKQKFKED